MKSKAEIRRQSLKNLSSLDPNLKRSWDRVLSDQLIEGIKHLGVQRIHCFVSTPSEFDTREIISYCWEASIQVHIPKIEPHGQMSHWRYQKGQELIAGPKGILEPANGLLMTEEPELIIVPGLAFSRDGKRIGYGGGYYDRFLSNKKDIPKWCIAYSFMLRDEIPSEDFDIIVDKVFTLP